MDTSAAFVTVLCILMCLESTGSSSKGPIGFSSIDHSGGKVVIENTSSGRHAKSQNIGGWHLVKIVNTLTTVDIVLKDFELNAGHSFTVWAKGAKDKATVDNEQISDIFSFGVGDGIWKVLDEEGNKHAFITV
ncbi:intermediate filament protein [Plakobranchus ocellatus]|uniref:Intermediate filament protein n=1 Tax=Plakobranchus ocellatus TaxID=259542 RepID=A0AAV3ZLZ0_9GAST|nr:intermediate filament protein [Plakobranchus ocellatus]